MGQARELPSSPDVVADDLFYLASELKGDVAARQRRLEAKRQRLVQAGILLAALGAGGWGALGSLLQPPVDHYQDCTAPGGGTTCCTGDCEDSA